MRGSTLFVAAALPGVLPSLLAQQPQTVTEVRSLLPFLTPTVQVVDLPFTAIPGERVPDLPFALEAGGDTSLAQWLVPMLTERHRGAIEPGRLHLVASDTNLVLRGDRSAVESCRRDLDALEATVARPIEVTAWRLPLPDGELPATVWSAAQLQQALANATPAWTAFGRTRAGGRLRLAQETEAGYLRDYDVEVAEKSRILDPKADVLFGGTRLSVVVDVLPGDELLLRGGWLHAERVALHAFDLGHDAGAIDQAEMATAALAFGGRIGNGGALVCAGRGGGTGPAGFLLVVGARFLAPPAADVAPDLLVRPVGAWGARPALLRPRLGWPRPGDDSPQFAVVPGHSLLGSDELRNLVDANGPGDVGTAHDLLVVSGDADACRRADALLQQLTAGLRNLGVVTRATADGLAPLEIALPALANWPAAAFVGRERAVVRDHEVEIAARASEANPVVGVARSGVAFGLTAAPDRSGVHVRGAWSVAAHDAPRLVVRKGDPSMPMQMVESRLTVLPWDASMPLDREHALGDGPAWTAGGPATKVTVRLVAR